MLLVQRNKPVPPVVEVLNAAPKGNSDPVSETVATDIIEKNNMSAVAEEEPRNGSDEKNIDNRQTSQEKPAVKSEVTTSRTETAKPPKESTVKDIEKTVVTPSVPSEEEINAEFETLITSGKSKMAEAQVSNGAADFAKVTEEISEAGLAFSKAAKLKTTDELIDLIGKCKVKEEEILLAGRKAQYEEIKPFGDLMIVQKKDTKKYGAIDANARERVKCKYLAAYRTQQGYGAFVRKMNCSIFIIPKV